MGLLWNKLFTKNKKVLPHSSTSMSMTNTCTSVTQKPHNKNETYFSHSSVVWFDRHAIVGNNWALWRAWRTMGIPDRVWVSTFGIIQLLNDVHGNSYCFEPCEECNKTFFMNGIILWDLETRVLCVLCGESCLKSWDNRENTIVPPSMWEFQRTSEEYKEIEAFTLVSIQNTIKVDHVSPNTEDAWHEMEAILKERNFQKSMNQLNAGNSGQIFGF